MECKCECKQLEMFTDTRDVRIVILQRGWVFVGVFSKKGPQCFLDSAMNIRNWGTKKGLGELANGPLTNTVLDPMPRIEFHELTVVATIKVNASRWDLK